MYNAVLMLVRSRSQATGLFSDTIPEDLALLAESEAILVVKCHAPDASFRGLARMMNAPIVLTVRDPRDCLVSFECAFQSERSAAFHELNQSAFALLEIADHPRQLVVKYEEFADRAKVIELLASLLGIRASGKLVRGISEALDPEVVKTKIAQWEVHGALDLDRPAEVWTEETHWHSNHVADGLTGKYVDQLSAHEAAIVGSRLRGFFETFGYARDPVPSVQSGERIEFNGAGMAYALDGFSFPEDWGAWTDRPTARIVLPLTKKTGRIQLEIALMRGSFDFAHRGAGTQLRVNNYKVAELFKAPEAPGDLLFVYSGDLDSDRLDLEFRFKGLASPKSLGLGGDDRLIGVGIKHLKITYR